MCAGTTSFESVKEYKADPSFYEDALGVNRFPSPERLRQRLDQTAQEEIDNVASPVHAFLRQANVDLLKQNSVKISPLPNSHKRALR